jgi:hypothetical protein
VVRRISTAEELLEFINLWMKIKSVNFNQSGKDEIIWKWIPNGEYTMRSAYMIQFYGSHPSFQVGNLWKVRAEPKVKVFRWTAMHQRILTANNLASRRMQPNPLCPLCDSGPEDAKHLLINCNFTREVLWLLWSWFHLHGSPSTCSVDQGPTEWLSSNAASAIGGKSLKNNWSATVLLLEHVEGKE